MADCYGHHDTVQDVNMIGDLGSAAVPLNAFMAVVVPSQIIGVLVDEKLVQDREKRA